MSRLDGKVALITGGGRGIGAAIAKRFVEDGAKIVISDIQKDTLEQTAHSLKSGMVAACAGDVTNWDDVQKMVKETVKFGGKIDILVNNAGITRDNLMLRMKDDEWDAVINTNLNSIYRMSKACLKAMTKERWGRIISISSVVGSSGNPGQANYAAAKAGLEGFSRALAREIGSRNITVNAVAPGFIATDMSHVLPEEQKEKLLASIPAGRLGQPEEIAAAVGFLASPEAAYITGVTLHVNGGMYME